MQNIETTLLIKLILMGAFFMQVVIFGKFISNLTCFSSGRIMSVAMTFSGSLFLSIALLDIIPQAISTFNIYFTETESSMLSQSSLHENEYLPLTMIIACVTFMIIMYIDKILVGGVHDHQYEVSLINQPKLSHRDMQLNKEMQTIHNQRLDNHQKAHGIADQFDQKSQPSSDTHKQSSQQHQQQQLKQNQHSNNNNYRPFILQAGMSIHAYFQCLAVGLQKTNIGVLSLASAILVHKWAQGLTLGLIYRKEGYSNKTSTIMIVVQGLINVLGLITGVVLIGHGNFVMAFFMSISAGTFLYISLAEVLFEQIRTLNQIKIFTILLANSFIAILVWFERFSEQMASNSDS